MSTWLAEMFLCVLHSFYKLLLCEERKLNYFQFRSKENRREVEFTRKQK
jgi:hypothetical protein